MTPPIQAPLTPSFAELAFQDGTPRKAFVTAFVVGSVLAVINHGDTMMSGESLPWGKILLTYCVPYCVTTWGAVTGKRALLNRRSR